MLRSQAISLRNNAAVLKLTSDIDEGKALIEQLTISRLNIKGVRVSTNN